MRKIRAATFVSMDGVLQGPGGPEEDPSGGFKFGGWIDTVFMQMPLGEGNRSLPDETEYPGTIYGG